MAMDLTSLLLGLAAAAVPLLALAWQLQRRASSRQTELSLLEERLATAQLAQEAWRRNWMPVATKSVT